MQRKKNVYIKREIINCSWYISYTSFKLEMFKPFNNFSFTLASFCLTKFENMQYCLFLKVKLIVIKTYRLFTKRVLYN